jgi:hypothetical protein
MTAPKPYKGSMLTGDLIMGMDAIADHLGRTLRQARYARETKALPIRYKLGFGIYAFKSELLDSLKTDDSLPPEPPDKGES